MEIPSSSEDSDYVPSEQEERRTIRHQAESSKRRQRKGETTHRGGGGASGSGSRISPVPGKTPDSDMPLANRRRKRAKSSDSDVPLANRRRKRAQEQPGGEGTGDSSGSEVDVPLGVRQPALLIGPGRSGTEEGLARPRDRPRQGRVEATGTPMRKLQGRSEGAAPVHRSSINRSVLMEKNPGAAAQTLRPCL